MRIDGFVAGMIVPHDVFKIGGLGDTGPLVKLAGVGPEIGVVGDAASIAFEMHVVD